MGDVLLVLGAWLVVSVPLALVVGRCIAARDRRCLRPRDASGRELERLSAD